MIVTPDNATLVVAESYGNRLTAFDIAANGSLSNRRTWAEFDGPESITDGSRAGQVLVVEAPAPGAGCP
jgi:sugar lactone lactonase YvrE